MLPVTATPNSLPSGFVYGFATAAFQIEGATSTDGRGDSVWDVICRTPGIIADGSDGSTGCDSYHQYKLDVDLLKQFGAKAYRFSIAWSRIIPLGGRNDPINQAGIDYYSKLLDLLLANGIEPYVTIFHWDLPTALQMRYGGWNDKKEIAMDFAHYAGVLFHHFGDRVKHWITINEPHVVCMTVEGMGKAGVLSDYTPDQVFRTANSLVWAHAQAVSVYRDNYQSHQKGRIGITLNFNWPEPFDHSEAAKQAAQNARDATVGLFADPIYLGRYADSLIKEHGDTLSFSTEEWQMVKGSSEFFGLNHYTTRWFTGETIDDPLQGNGLSHQFNADGNPIGLPGHGTWAKTVPWGFRKALTYVNTRYVEPSHLELVITENGFPVKNEHSMAMDQVINDIERQNYFAGYLKEVEAAVKDGINITGYFAWSLLDNFEWNSGYEPRFGVVHVDRKNGYLRTPKDSARFLKNWFEVAIA